MFKIYVDDGQNPARVFIANGEEELESIKKQWEYLDSNGKLNTLVWRVEEFKIRIEPDLYK